MNKPALLFNALTGMQLLIVLVSIPLLLSINLIIGLLISAIIIYLVRIIIKENKKGNYGYVENLISFKKRYFTDKSNILKYLQK